MSQTLTSLLYLCVVEHLWRGSVNLKLSLLFYICVMLNISGWEVSVLNSHLSLISGGEVSILNSLTSLLYLCDVEHLWRGSVNLKLSLLSYICVMLNISGGEVSILNSHLSLISVHLLFYRK